MREQIEVIYVRCVLKPIETFQPKPKKSNSKEAPVDLSIPDVNDNLLADSADTEEPKPSGQDSLLQQMHLNFVIETLLGLTAEQLAYFFLVFDCQPFSENLV